MKLAPASILYRVLQKAGRLSITLVFLGSVGTQFSIGRELLLGGIAVIVAVTLAYELAYYQRFRYAFTDDTFDVSWGVINRREREIPYGRMQNVDISRNVIQRVLGLSAVNIETAGGGSTEASINYVTSAAADRIQSEIRTRKRAAGADRADGRAGQVVVDETAAGDERSVAGEGERTDDPAEDELLFEIAPSELALAGILSFDPRVPGLLFALFTGSVPFISPIIPQTNSVVILLIVGVIGLVGLILISWLVGAVSAVVNYWGFRLTRSATELRYERGLLQQYSGTIPFDKIQTLTITDNPLKRRAGYATLAVETAGYAPGQATERGSEAAVPIASRDRIERLAAEIDGCEMKSFERPPKRIRRRYLARYLLALAALTGLLYGVGQWLGVGMVSWYVPLVGLVLAPIAAHYKWLHRGYWLGDDHLVTRNGVWSRETKRVAYHRIQTVIDTRTIFQRRWRVATVTADTAGSLSLLGNDAAAVDIEADDATTLRGELRQRLQAALAARRRHRGNAAATPTGDGEGVVGDAKREHSDDPTDA